MVIGDEFKKEEKYMKTNTTTKETFEQVHDEHFFKSMAELDEFIKSLDPLDELKPVKKEINWKPQKRIDPKTGREFLATHPAQIYENEKTIQPAKKRGRSRKRKVPVDFLQPKVKDCESCGRHFIATAPNMKYCNECSEKGGELVKS